MIFSRKLLFSILCFIAMPVHAIFFRGERFVDRHGNSIECFGDLHIPCNKSSVTRNQQMQLINYACESDAFVIVEDMNARYEESRLTEFYDIDITCTTPLDNLSTQCDAAGIDCCNVEFRELSAASLAGFPIPACDTLLPFNQVVSEVLRYNDCHVLKAYNWQTLSTLLSKNQSLINQLQNVDSSLGEYCQSMCAQARDKINLFDVSLIDLRILHAIYENRKRSKIFVCAGANHIERIIPTLRKLGYRSVSSVKKDILMQSKDFIDADSAISLTTYFKQTELQCPYIVNYQRFFSWAC